MHSPNCLNCGALAEKKFCPECGQKADTHRITFKHFVMHDLVHGVWHVDKGIPFTIKETFTRPGYAARDYIAGKRKNYYNIFYLSLLVLGFIVLVTGIGNNTVTAEPGSAFEKTPFVLKYFKVFILSFIPLLAVNAYLLFRRLKLNFTEHMIISGFSLLGTYLFILIGYILSELFFIMETVLGIISILFPVIVYYQATKPVYKLPGFAWRILIFYMVLLIEVLLFAIAFMAT